jgi:DNA-binding transcriptional regulator YiaG
MDDKGVTGDQMRAARALVGLDGPKLAKKSGVSLATVRRFEKGLPGSNLARNALLRTLESAGIEFIPRGVRLKDEPSEPSAE